jgi:hypothetical protein
VATKMRVTSPIIIIITIIIILHGAGYYLKS